MYVCERLLKRKVGDHVKFNLSVEKYKEYGGGVVKYGRLLCSYVSI